MSVDLTILREDPDLIVLRKHRSLRSTLLPLIVCAVFSVVGFVDSQDAIQSLPLGRAVATLIRLGFGAAALYFAALILFDMRSTVTFRAGLDRIAQRHRGLILGWTRSLVADEAKVSLGVREAADRDNESGRIYAPAGMELDLIRKDAKPLRLGCIDDGNAIRLTEHLNAILAGSRTTAPPGP